MGREANVDVGNVVARYNRTLAAFGTTGPGVHWESTRRQYDRFEVLAPLFEGPFTVNDFGCGYGAFFDFAIARLPLARYHGVDASEQMINAARKRVTDTRATFATGTKLSSMADYSIASGTFNLCGSNPHDRWHRWILTALRNMWDNSRRGIGFNVLHTNADEGQPEFYFADPGVFAAWCRQSLSSKVDVIVPQDGNDWTIFVHHEDGDTG